MLIIPLSLLFFASITKGEEDNWDFPKIVAEPPYDRYPYGAPTNGKLISPLNTGGRGKMEIPECHERRIRKTFYTLTRYQLNLFEHSMIDLIVNKMRPGHLVYPLVITSEEDYCDGGTRFESLIEKIYKDDEIDPFKNIINADYTDNISNACDENCCDHPLSKRETITLGYPNRGFEQLMASEFATSYVPRYFGKAANETTEAMVRQRVRSFIDERMWLPIDRSYHSQYEAVFEIPRTTPYALLQPLKCVFTEPSC